MAAFTSERVLTVDHWSDRLFSFSTTRPASLRFDSGQFLMLGIDACNGRRISRAYSIASAHYEEQLDFYSVKVPGGEFTSRLKGLRIGDPIWVSAKPTGTLVLRDLKPGRRLFLLATGTGVAPFLSIIKDPETYVCFEQVFLVRGGAYLSDLAYATTVVERLRADSAIGDLVSAGLVDYPSVTRAAHPHRGRITSSIESGALFADLAIAPLDPRFDRAMVCGSMRLLSDLERMLIARGFEGSPSTGVPGDYVIERAFVDTATQTVAPLAREVEEV